MKSLLCLLAVLAAVPFAATAQRASEVVEGRLLAGWRMEDGRHMAAVQLSLAPGWKTYWRSPGDAGIPPRITWRGSDNLVSVAPHWPVPEVFEQNGFRSVGYKGVVTIPFELRPRDASRPITLEAELEIGVCEDICIPVTLRLDGLMPADGAGPGSAAIRAALADRPMTAAEADVGKVVCEVAPIDDGVRLTVSINMPRHFRNEATVVEFSDPEVWISEATTTRTGGRLVAVTEMVPPEAAPFAMARDGVRITVLGDGRAVDIRGCTAS